MQSNPQSSRIPADFFDNDGPAVSEEPETTADIADLKDPDARHGQASGTEDKVAWTVEIQREILGLCLRNADAASRILPLIEPSWLNDNQGPVAAAVKSHWLEYGTTPSPSVLRETLREVVSERRPEVQAKVMGEMVATIHGPVAIESVNWYAEKVRKMRNGIVAKRAALGLMKSVREGDDGLVAMAAVATQIPSDSGLDDGCYDLDQLRKIKDVRWLIQDHVPVGDKGSVACVYGPPGSGKSFLAIDAALSVAAGVTFLSRFEVEQAPVFYLAYEGGAGLRKRVEAWREANPGVQIEPHHLIVCRNSYDFRETGTAAIVAQLAKAKCKTPPGLIVVDTLARSLAGGSDVDDMASFVATAAKLAELTLSAVLVVHHCGKDGEIRGRTDLPGGCDAIFSVTGKPAEGMTVKCRKQKDHEELAAYQLGCQSHGESITLTWSGSVSKVKAQAKAAAADDDAARVLAAVPQGPEGATIKELMAALKQSRSTIQRWIKPLVDAETLWLRRSDVAKEPDRYVRPGEVFEDGY